MMHWNRRAVLKTSGLLAAGALAGFGASQLVRLFGDAPSAPRVPLPPVQVARNRIIRTVVGLRPFRRSGFRVERERIGGKSIVHNYGHGGGGLSLSWGSAELAIEQLTEIGALPASVAVLGAGAVGLATARLLQRRGAAVTIYAKDLPPDTTSDAAAGKWDPFLVADPARQPLHFEAQFERAARLSHRMFQDLVDEDYGVRWLPVYAVDGDAPKSGLFPEIQTLEPGEHDFPAEHVVRYMTMMIEPPVYLKSLMRDVLLAGGRVVAREFRGVADVLALPEAAIVNCTGLGAKKLFGDDDLVPVKGQLTVLVPQPEVGYMAMHSGLYMMPRRDGILLGGTLEFEEWSLEPNHAAAELILDGHAKFFGAMRANVNKT